MEIKVKNFKCFGAEAQGYDNILPVNIIIGRNNSGKSSLIELIEQLVKPDHNFFLGTKKTEILIKDTIPHSAIKQTFRDNMRHDFAANYGSDYEFATQWVNTLISYSISDKSLTKKNISFEKKPPAGTVLFNQLPGFFALPFNGSTLLKISSERDIEPEVENGDISVTKKGFGATNLIRSILTNGQSDGKLVEKTFLKELNKILNPEINFSRILVKKIVDKWEIYFENETEDLIPLSKMGSGIKTILLVLVNLILIPNVQNIDKNIIFAFEELENNLHPSLQRRLFAYLRKFIEDTNHIFFLTTHSNIVIDLFSNDKSVQVTHVSNSKGNAATLEVSDYETTRKVLEDLDIRASDVLQSNGIIWVEGPSDRIYIRKWLSLLDPELKENVHFSIMFYGGRMLSHVHVSPEFINEELIPLLRINVNAYVVIDKDGKSITSALNKTKTRIAHELGEQSTWISAGREIENYLPPGTLKAWLVAKKKNVDKLAKFDRYSKLEEYTPGIKYAQNKVKFAREICSYISDQDLETMDLKKRIGEIAQHIRKWNKL